MYHDSPDCHLVGIQLLDRFCLGQFQNVSVPEAGHYHFLWGLEMWHIFAPKQRGGVTQDSASTSAWMVFDSSPLVLSGPGDLFLIPEGKYVSLPQFLDVPEEI